MPGGYYNCQVSLLFGQVGLPPASRPAFRSNLRPPFRPFTLKGTCLHLGSQWALRNITNTNGPTADDTRAPTPCANPARGEILGALMELPFMQPAAQPAVQRPLMAQHQGGLSTDIASAAGAAELLLNPAGAFASAGTRRCWGGGVHRQACPPLIT